jgi:hypothetical protein
MGETDAFMAAPLGLSAVGITVGMAAAAVVVERTVRQAVATLAARYGMAATSASVSATL